MITAALLLIGLAPQAEVPKITTAVGTGEKGYAGDGGKATDAKLNQPFHCALDKRGNLYVAEAMNHCIRRVDRKTGIITTVAGNGKKGYTGDGGPATEATFNEPYALAMDADNNMLIVDRLNAVIRRVDGETGIITTIASTKGELVEPNDCCLDGKGGLLIADVRGWKVRRLDLRSGKLTTFAGVGPRKGKPDRDKLGDGGPASKAVIVEARAVCVDHQGNTYICERRGSTIRRVDVDGIITTIAGTGAKGFKDGPGLKAVFNAPKGVRCDPLGNVYVVDTENHAIRKIDNKTWEVTTIAGGQKGTGGDGGAATKGEMDRPHGCVIDAGWHLYIADSNNHRVRLVPLPKP